VTGEAEKGNAGEQPFKERPAELIVDDGEGALFRRVSGWARMAVKRGEVVT